MNQELQYAFRLLRKDKIFALLAVLTLSIGAGLVITMFSVVNGIYLKGLPFEKDERLVHLERDNIERGLKGLSVTVDDFVDWQSGNDSFEALGAYRTDMALTLATEGIQPQRFQSAKISVNFSKILMTEPAVGRSFSEDDTQAEAPPVAMISYSVWERLFNANRAVVGSTATINDEPTTIIGVMPKGFSFPTNEEVWTPLRLNKTEGVRQRWGDLQVFGRLKAGTTINQARIEFEKMAIALEEAYPEENAGIRPVLKPFLFEYSGGQVQKTVTLMFIAVCCVLLIACANVTNLLLVRAVQRGRELAIRSALGATRAAMIRQMFLESILISVAGSLIGLLLGAWAIDAIWWVIESTRPPFWYDFSLDWRVFGFVILVTILMAIASGLIPALQASRPNVNAMLKDITRTTTNFRIGAFSKVLVVAQIALSCALLIAAGLTIRTLVNLQEMPLQFDSERVLTARISLFENSYPSTISRIQFFNTLETGIREAPGVEHASIASNPPGGGSSYTYFAVDGSEAQPSPDFPFCRIDMVSDTFFETYGVEARAGRVFDYRDQDQRLNSVLVNEAFLQRHLPGQKNPVGRRIKIHSGEPGWESNPWLTIVGVVPDLRMNGLIDDGGTGAGLYLPLNQIPPTMVTLSVKSIEGLDPTALVAEIRQAVKALNPNLPLFDIMTFSQLKEEQTFFFKVVGAVFSAFGLVSIGLATIGIYGVMSFTVRQSSQEIGIRMALGADRGEILQFILGQGIWQLSIGLGIGMIIAVGITEVLDIALYEVAPNDPLTFLTVVVILSMVGLSASFFPALKASHIQPLEALRAH